MNPASICLRTRVTAQDIIDIATMVADTGFFSPDEEDIAVELAQESLQDGPDESGYHFLLADDATTHKLLGYACLGPTPGTEGTFDLYWVVVSPSAQGRGLGRELLQKAAAQVQAAGGRLLYAETSGREQYEPTRRFYTACGFASEAVLKDFYRPGDDKVIFRLEING